ncbi:putative C2H2 transcription factor [Talaromyces proteolyticus]|uniref:C2H2 transcription factor n=1 Tax=Talaromyces proteolyticus TaxID=1131652 RepID=A0AAD4KX98_9EURO|nr:putative C2H2 transcription factor [Talaromyces proteolyticus]KAH8698872.1 putative C2H2 transcription factor [Talaromyces proteolyticus]
MSDASDTTTPPSLHYSPSISDLDPPSTGASTPIRTPVGFGVTSFARKPSSRGKDSFSWTQKPADPGNQTVYLDSAVIDDDALSTFPLFPSSPAQFHTMSGPFDLSARQTSVSPPGQQASNLTSALQKAANNDRPGSISNPTASNASAVYKAAAARKDSLGASMAQWGNGTKPISVMGSNREKPRRESLAGSLVGGMSWGGISVGSWIRDDIIMTGTSPFTSFQSPSFHSSSYLPKLEANFMRDFSCCGITLPTLHDLLQHYEEAHAQKSPQQGQRPSQGDNRAAMATAAAAVAQTQSHGQSVQANQSNNGQPKFNPNQTIDTSNFTSQQNLDLDTIDDMEMDDAMGDTDSSHLFSSQIPTTQGGFASPNQRVPQLNLSMLQGQGLRGSQPGTPVAPAHTVLQNNPTVSSVNTPTLSSNPLQNAQFRNTPDSSGPGTPAELDESVLGGFNDLSMQAGLAANGQFPGFGSNDMVDLCIDEPAKRLFSPNGGFGNGGSQVHMKLGNSQYGPNSDIARRIREQQMLAGVPDTSLGMLPTDEPKPFRCPVIGCEKAYKNQNGLKYHKAHGHNNQQLHENGDGTFSIVNPETAAPYPGTMGMEKEKPYRCEVCGKRYKNLNGLKYHKSHSPPCNPDLQLAGRNLNLGGVMQGQNINVAGAGLPGIGEEGLL